MQWPQWYSANILSFILIRVCCVDSFNSPLGVTISCVVACCPSIRRLYGRLCRACGAFLTHQSPFLTCVLAANDPECFWRLHVYWEHYEAVTGKQSTTCVDCKLAGLLSRFAASTSGWERRCSAHARGQTQTVRAHLIQTMWPIHKTAPLQLCFSY